MNPDEVFASAITLLTADRDGFLAGLEKKAGAVYQAVFQRGHDIGYGKKNGELQKVQADVTRLTGELEAKDIAIGDLRKGDPKVKEQVEAYQQEIADLKGKHKREMEAKDALVTSERFDRTLSDFKAKLVSLGIDPDYADVQVHKADTRNRIRFAPDGTRQVMQAGKEIPFANDTDALDQMADEYHKATPPKFLGSDVAPGGGANKGKPPAGGGGDVFTNIREKAQAERAEAKKAVAPNPAVDRMGVGAGPTR